MAEIKIPQRKDAWELLCKFTKSDSLRRHALGVEQVMRCFARKYNSLCGVVASGLCFARKKVSFGEGSEARCSGVWGMRPPEQTYPDPHLLCGGFWCVWLV